MPHWPARFLRPKTRTSTGLHRIGVVLATPLVLAAIGLAAWELRPLPECKSMFDNLVPNGDRCRVTQSSVGASDPVLSPGKSVARAASAPSGSLDMSKLSDEELMRIAGEPSPPNSSGPPKLVPVDYDPFAPGPDFTFAGLCLAAGALLYAAARSLGWIIDGFTGADR